MKFFVVLEKYNSKLDAEMLGAPLKVLHPKILVVIEFKLFE